MNAHFALHVLMSHHGIDQLRYAHSAEECTVLLQFGLAARRPGWHPSEGQGRADPSGFLPLFLVISHGQWDANGKMG